MKDLKSETVRSVTTAFKLINFVIGLLGIGYIIFAIMQTLNT